MARSLCRPCAIVPLLVLLLGSVQLSRCDDLSAAETEKLRNTPPELSSGVKPSTKESSGKAQARFLPFSASFSLSAGGNNAQTFSVASGPDGIGLAQSSSQAVGSSNGSPGFSTSQSSSLAAGLNGISASDSNAVASNHPLYGSTSHANANSFTLGQAAASSHGDVVNGQAVSGAQSSVGSTQVQAASNAQSFVQQAPSNAPPNYASGNNGDYYYNSRQPPSLTITVSDKSNQGRQPSGGWYEVSDSNSRDTWQPPHFCKNYNGWYRDPRCRRPEVTITKPGYINKPFYENRDPRQQRPGIKIRPISSVTSAQSSAGGLSLSQSSAQSGGGHHPSATTVNQAQVSGNAQAHAQGAAGSTSHGYPGQLGANLSSGSVSLTSRPGGFAQGSSHASSSNGGSTSHTTGTSSGGASAQSNANAGSVAFPGPSSHTQIIPAEFVRSAKISKKQDSLEELVDDITDTVYEILDY